MKDQYVGDVKDFAKYALLKRLAGSSGEDRLRLGVVWYLTPPGGRYGLDTAYLKLPRPNMYTEADPELFSGLQRLIEKDRRSIEEVPSDGLLPPDTAFFAVPVDPAARRHWFYLALEATSLCDLVFLDPDIGLAAHNARRPGVEYALLQRRGTGISRT